MGAKDAKIAAAPISWGVCEVPGWGHQMSPERVLKEMSDLLLMPFIKGWSESGMLMSDLSIGYTGSRGLLV